MEENDSCSVLGGRIDDKRLESYGHSWEDEKIEAGVMITCNAAVRKSALA